MEAKSCFDRHHQVAGDSQTKMKTKTKPKSPKTKYIEKTDSSSMSDKSLNYGSIRATFLVENGIRRLLTF